MKKGKNTAEILDNEEFEQDDDIELSESGYEDRTLVLKAAPPSRKAQLLALGVQEIRCSCCNRIMPLAGAEDGEEGWLCEKCVPELTWKPKQGRRAS